MQVDCRVGGRCYCVAMKAALLLLPLRYCFLVARASVTAAAAAAAAAAARGVEESSGWNDISCLLGRRMPCSTETRKPDIADSKRGSVGWGSQAKTKGKKQGSDALRSCCSKSFFSRHGGRPTDQANVFGQ